MALRVPTIRTYLCKLFNGKRGTTDFSDCTEMNKKICVIVQ
jgi:hypothetical protein